MFGNGGSAANASHFATDLGKGSSDKVGKCFRVLSLNDNVSWMTALGNDYTYDEVFVRQLMNYGKPGDLVLTMSVSGNSPNLVKAIDWAKKIPFQCIPDVGREPEVEVRQFFEIEDFPNAPAEVVEQEKSWRK